MRTIREAIRREHKLKIRYLSLAGAETDRVIWPVALVFFESTRLVAGWCELRRDFRHFRADRISSLEAMGTAYPRARRELVRLWRQQLGTPDSPADGGVAD